MNEAQHHSIGKALGRIPSGVFILTARHGDEQSAMMASWVQQVAFDPPMVSLAIAGQRPIARLIRDSGRFALSVLGQDDGYLMKKYARGVPPGDDAFAEVKTMEVTGGVRVLADALAYLDCRLHRNVDLAADHELFIGIIETGRQLREGPAFIHQRGNGFHY